MALYFNNGFGKLGSDDEISKVPRNSLIVNDNKNLIFKLDNGETCNFTNDIILAIGSGFSQVLEDYQPKGNYLTTDDAEDYRLKEFNEFGPLEVFPGNQSGAYIDFHNSGSYSNHGSDDYAARLIHQNNGAFEINCNGGINLNNNTTINGDVFKAGYYTAGLNNNTTDHWGIEYNRNTNSVKLETYTGEHDTRWHTGGIKLQNKVVYPIYDGNSTTNVIDLGTSNYKFKDIYCNNLYGQVTTKDLSGILTQDKGGTGKGSLIGAIQDLSGSNRIELKNIKVDFDNQNPTNIRDDMSIITGGNVYALTSLSTVLYARSIKGLWENYFQGKGDDRYAIKQDVEDLEARIAALEK